MVVLEVKNPLPMKEMHVLIPELGRYLGGLPKAATIQYSCLENSMDRETW